jgi:hypothetical protein
MLIFIHTITDDAFAIAPLTFAMSSSDKSKPEFIRKQMILSVSGSIIVKLMNWLSQCFLYCFLLAFFLSFITRPSKKESYI